MLLDTATKTGVTALPSSVPDTDYRVHTLLVTNSSSALRELSIRGKKKPEKLSH